MDARPLYPHTTAGSGSRLNAWPFSLLALVGLAFALRLFLMPSYIEFIDGRAFVLALERYDLLRERPHWPGYPVYIWAGRLVQRVVSEPVQALHVLSALASSLSLVPIALLASGWRRALGGSERDTHLAGLTAALLWTVLPLSLIDGTEIFSDPLALLLALFMLLACWYAVSKENSLIWLVTASALGGLMLGVRLSYIALLLPLAYVVWVQGNHASRPWLRRAQHLVIAAVSFLLPVALWFGWQWSVSSDAFIAAAQQHLSGHYGGWGGSVTTDEHLGDRPLRFLRTLSVYGLGAWWSGAPWVRLLVTTAWVGLLALCVRHLSRTINYQPLILALLWAVPYALWVGLSHDVELPRYMFPLTALLCIVAALGLPTRYALPAALTVVVAVMVVSLPLGWEHRQVAPVDRQLAEYLLEHRASERGVLLVEAGLLGDDRYSEVEASWRDTLPLFTLFRSIDRLVPGYMLRPLDPHFWTSQVNALEKRGRDVYYLSVIGTAPSEGWQAAARFCRNPLIKSRELTEATLYRYRPNAISQATPSCYVFSERLVDRDER